MCESCNSIVNITIERGARGCCHRGSNVFSSYHSDTIRSLWIHVVLPIRVSTLKYCVSELFVLFVVCQL